jgi:probable blue pigment (indigoidine) exporter
MSYRPSDVFLTALAPLSWGSTYLVTTEFLPVGRPLLSGCLRALPAGLALALVTRIRPVGSWWVKAAILGVLNIGGFFALLFAAAYRLPGGIAAAVGAIQPLIAVGLAAVLLRERPQAMTLAAVSIGMVGVVVLVTRSTAQLNATGLGFALGGACCMATGVVLTKHWGRPVTLLAFTSWQLIAGGLFLLPIVAIVEGAPAALTTRNVIGYLWLITIGTALAYSLWFRGIGLLPVVATSVLGALSPVVAALLGWLVLHQRLSAAQIIGALTAIGAVVTAQLNISQTAKSLDPRLEPIHLDAPVDVPGSTTTDEEATRSDLGPNYPARLLTE